MSDASMPIESVIDLNYRLGFAFGKEEGVREAGAKLFEMRQLVVDAHKCKVHDSCCEDCYADTGECPVEHRMRELRIEVEQCPTPRR